MRKRSKGYVLLPVAVLVVAAISCTSVWSKKYKDEARRNAVKAAEEKAQLLCEAASSGNHKPSLGKIIRISEAPFYSDWNGKGYNIAVQNRVAYAQTAGGTSESGGAPIGKILFDAQIEMVFELR